MQNDKVHLSPGQPSAAEGKERRRPKGPLRRTDVDLGRAVQANRPNGAVPADDLVIAGRYRITKGAHRDGRCGLHANDLSTNQRVFLKPCSRSSQPLKRLINMHNVTEESKRVCKLIEMLPGTEHLPPCLVFEAGAFTLAQRLGGRAMAPGEKLAIVHAILTALGDLHQWKIAHGNLDPSHIVWSSADLCWKFADLDFAARFGDPLPLHQRVATRYTAPEIRRAIDEDISAPADGSADIWAFGLIAFEIFTGTSAVDAAAVRRFVAAERGRLLEQLERESLSGTGVSRGLFKKPPQRLREFEFVLRLLSERKTDRPTATHALESSVFGVAVKHSDPLKQMEDVLRSRKTLGSDTRSSEKWLACVASFKHHLNLDISVERFAQKGQPEAAFHGREATRTKRFVDGRLPQHPVYVLPAGEQFRLRISLSLDGRMRFPFDRVVFVKLQTPEGEVQSLELWQQCRADRLDAMARVVPSDFESPRLNTKCPLLGLADAKYVRLTVHIRFRLGDGFPYEFDLHWPVYLQLKRPQGRLSCFGAMPAAKGALL